MSDDTQDIVWFLRDVASQPDTFNMCKMSSPLVLEAADTIEDLRAENHKLYVAAREYDDSRQALQWEVLRLREALKPFKEAAEELEDWENGSMRIWERSAALSITCGDLRNCQRIYDGSTVE